MSGEPKTHTPEEGTLAGLIATLGIHGYSLTFQEGRWWAVPPQDTPYEWCEGDTPGEAASKALGAPVVARDEASELRAENERLRADLFEYVLDGFVQGAHRQEDGGYHTGGISTYRDLGDWLVEHAGWTRRDGGSGRIQVYDPPALEAEAGQ